MEARPLATSEVCQLLGIREHKLHLAVRQGAVRPRTEAGRRWWTSQDVILLAKHYDKDSLELRRALEGIRC